MRRRDILGATTAGAAAAALLASREALGQERAARAQRGMPTPKIKDVSVIE